MIPVPSDGGNGVGGGAVVAVDDSHSTTWTPGPGAVAQSEVAVGDSDISASDEAYSAAIGALLEASSSDIMAELPDTLEPPPWTVVQEEVVQEETSRPTMMFAGVKKSILKKPSEQLVGVQKQLKKKLHKMMDLDEDEDAMPDTIPRIMNPVITQLREVIAQHRVKHNAGENLITKAIGRLTEPQLKELSLLCAKGKHGVWQHDRVFEIAHVISPELMLIDDCKSCLKAVKADAMDLVVDAFTTHYMTEKMTINSSQLEKDVNEQIGVMKGVRLMVAQDSQDNPATIPPSTDTGDRCAMQ